MRFLSSASAGALLAAVVTAEAGTVDLRNLPGNYFVQPWGQSDTTLYAQSVVADAPVLATAAWRAQATPVDDIPFNLLITGARPDAGGLGLAPNFADLRFSSPFLLPYWEDVAFTAQPNLPVTPGETLFLVFDTFSYPEAGFGSMYATAYQGPVDAYPAGEFVYLNSYALHAPSLPALDAYPWQHRAADHQDLAIYAEFTPEPGTVSLLLLGVTFYLRRCRRAT